MYRIPQWITRWLKPWIICSFRPDDQRSVWITFDDGPHPESTPQILEILKQHQIRASFFVLGSNALKYQEWLNKVSDAGHDVHLHSLNHQKAARQSTSSFLEELEQCRRIIGSSFYRPPYGKIPLRLLFPTLNRKFRIVLWNVDMGDYKTNPPDLIRLKKLIHKIQPGDIILLHDNPEFILHTITILPLLLKDLQKKNVNFTTFL